MTKATFQNRVPKAAAKGVPGDKASMNPCIYTGRNYISGDSKVAAGNFVWADLANLSNQGTGAEILTALSSGTGQPLGLVQRVLTQASPDVQESGNASMPACPLSIIQCGDAYVVSANDAAPDHKVYAMLADGSIQTGAAGAGSADSVETPWTVTEGGAAGEPITISNWSLS